MNGKLVNILNLFKMQKYFMGQSQHGMIKTIFYRSYDFRYLIYVNETMTFLKTTMIMQEGLWLEADP